MLKVDLGVRHGETFTEGLGRCKIEAHLHVKPNDLFVALNGGKIFSKIDFTEAYLQLPRDDNSKYILVFNTHKGLFHFNRLPYRMVSAPSIFQKTMDMMLADLNGTVSCLDDIIVITGTDLSDHFKNSTQVFELCIFTRCNICFI